MEHLVALFPCTNKALGLKSFCMEFACSTFACMSSLWSSDFLAESKNMTVGFMRVRVYSGSSFFSLKKKTEKKNTLVYFFFSFFVSNKKTNCLNVNGPICQRRCEDTKCHRP